MATIVCQRTIWEDMEREVPPGLRDVEVFLSVLSEVDGDLVRQLREKRRHGRNDLRVSAMWNLIAVNAYLRHGKFSELLGELRRNSDLARILGFEEIGPNQYRIPSSSALSRLHVKLKSKQYLEKVEEVFARTVSLLQAEYPELGENSALDASDVRTHAQPGRKASKKKEENSAEAGTENEEEKPSSDPEASWSVKTKKWEDGEGKQRKETKSTFGYKLYVNCDVDIPAILSLDVTTGSASDHKMAMPMLDAAQQNLGAEGKIKTMAMDKGFDSEENVRQAHHRGVAAIVPVREVPDNLQSKPTEDREEAVSPGGNVVYDRYTGDVFCYDTSRGAGEEPERRKMKYAGFEATRECHKFRCPLGALAATNCGAFRSCAAGSSGNQGRQIRVSMETDCRRFAPVYPQSHRWKRLYNGRSAVERINSYVKGVLRLEDHCLRGKNAITLRSLLAATTLNLRTVISLRQAKVQSEAA
jgi:hypothetical protein